MSEKRVSVSFLVYAEDGTVVGHPQAEGITTDEGATVIIPHGYVPGIETADPALITVRVHSPPTDKTPTAVTRADDPDANTTTLSFTLPS